MLFLCLGSITHSFQSGGKGKCLHQFSRLSSSLQAVQLAFLSVYSLSHCAPPWLRFSLPWVNESGPLCPSLTHTHAPGSSIFGSGSG